MAPISETIDAWVRSMEAGDAEAAAPLLAAGVVLHSPITEQYAFRGRDAVVELFRAVHEVVSDIRVQSVAMTPSGAIVRASADVDGIRLDEAQFIQLGSDGQITELTMFFRPLTASTRFLRLIGPNIARRQEKPWAARVLGLAGPFLDSVATSGDKTFVPMTAPAAPASAPPTPASAPPRPDAGNPG